MTPKPDRTPSAARNHGAVPSSSGAGAVGRSGDSDGLLPDGLVTRPAPDSAAKAPQFLMTKAGTFTAEAIEHLVARIEELEGDLALTRKEKSILMRELSRFTGNA